MGVAELITTYKELGFGGLLLLFVFFMGRYLIRQNKQCYEAYEEHVTQHKNELKEITTKMFAVVDENTKANTALAKTIEHLDDKIGMGKISINGN